MVNDPATVVLDNDLPGAAGYVLNQNPWGGATTPAMQLDADRVNNRWNVVQPLTAPTATAGTNTTQVATTAFVNTAVPIASSTTPGMDGTAAIGAGTTWARADHIHPHDTTLLPKAGGTLTGPLVLANAVNLEFTDTGGHTTLLNIAADNHMIFQTSNGAGGNVVVWGIYAAMAAPTLTFYVPIALNSTVGFNGTAPVAKPTVTGAKGSNAALASLLTALASYGLITDSTTA
jgi:hypothetical protein